MGRGHSCPRRRCGVKRTERSTCLSRFNGQADRSVRPPFEPLLLLHFLQLLRRQWSSGERDWVCFLQLIRSLDVSHDRFGWHAVLFAAWREHAGRSARRSILTSRRRQGNRHCRYLCHPDGPADRAMLALKRDDLVDRTIRQIENLFPALVTKPPVLRGLHQVPVHRAFEGKVVLRELVHQSIPTRCFIQCPR